MKKLFCFILILVMSIMPGVCAPISPGGGIITDTEVTVDPDPEETVSAGIVIDTFTVDDGGNVRVIGHITNPSKSGAQIAYLITVKGNPDEIVYINQMETGNNGTFYISHPIDASFSEKTVIVRFGSDTKATQSFEYTLSSIPPGIEQVVNNSVLYGKDVYTLDSFYLNADYVSDSIASGGNVIYYKIGDLWYNLLDEKATSSAFLVPENAVTYEEIKAKPLRYYYMQGKKIDFKQ